MKKLLLITLLLTAIVMAGPFLSGQKAEVALDQWVNVLNESGTYDVSWDYYNKSWLTTDAVLLIKLNSAVDIPLVAGFRQDWVLPLHIQINHGPLLIKDNFRQGWFSGQILLSREHEGWIKDHVQVDGSGPFYTSNIYMDLSGDIHINDYSLPFSVEDNGEVIRVEGYVGQGTMSLNQQVEYSGLLPTIHLKNQKGEVAIENVDFKLSTNLAKKYGKYIAPGVGLVSVKSIKAKVDQEQQFSLSNASAQTSVKFNTNNTDADFAVTIGFKQLQTLGETVNDAHFAMSFERLSLAFMDKYLNMIKQFGSIGAESSTMMAMQMSQFAASDLLPAGPKLSISALEFSTNEGALTFAGDVEISPDAATKMSNPLSIISDITINASVEVDKALAQKLTVKSALKEINNELLMSGDAMSEEEKTKMAEQQSTMQLSLLVIQGMLTEKNTQYTSQFQFKNGSALLNGQAMPLPF